MNIQQRFAYWAKQKFAGDSRFYGDGGTVHDTGYLDIESIDGVVVAVWFRCQQLPFQQFWISEYRANELGVGAQTADLPQITGIELKDKDE